MTPSSEPRLPSSHPDYARQNRLARLFNLSLAEYDAILAHQGGRCAICKRRPEEIGAGDKRLAVDHHHKTGLIRGLVCWPCNTAVAKLKDDLQLVLAVGEYLAHPPAARALGEPRYGRKGRVTTKARKKSPSASARKKPTPRPKKKRGN